MGRIVVVMFVVLIVFFAWLGFGLSRKIMEEGGRELSALEAISEELVLESDVILEKIPELRQLLSEERRLREEVAPLEASSAYGEAGASDALQERERRIEENLKKQSPIGLDLDQRITAFDKRLFEYHGRLGELYKRTDSFPPSMLSRLSALPRLGRFGSISEQLFPERRQTGNTSR